MRCRNEQSIPVGEIGNLQVACLSLTRRVVNLIKIYTCIYLPHTETRAHLPLVSKFHSKSLPRSFQNRLRVNFQDINIPISERRVALLEL